MLWSFGVNNYSHEMSEYDNESDNEARPSILSEIRFVFSLFLKQIKQFVIKCKCLKV
jgi:hypothetical protein